MAWDARALHRLVVSTRWIRGMESATPWPLRSFRTSPSTSPVGCPKNISRLMGIWWEYDWFILIYRLIILLTIGYITLNIKTQWCSIPMTDPWCCYIWCSMDPIIIYPSHVSIYNIYIYNSTMDPMGYGFAMFRRCFNCEVHKWLAPSSAQAVDLNRTRQNHWNLKKTRWRGGWGGAVAGAEDVDLLEVFQGRGPQRRRRGRARWQRCVANLFSFFGGIS